MDFGSVRAVALDAQFDLLGVDVTVSAGGVADPIVTKGIWVDMPAEDMPHEVGRQAAFLSSSDVTRREPRRVLALRRRDVPTVPRGSEILAPAYGGGVVLRWVVDGYDRYDRAVHDSVRVVVIADPVAGLA